MGFFKDTHTFRFDDHTYQVVVKTTLGKDVHAALFCDGEPIDHDDIDDPIVDDRDFKLRFKLKDGRRVRIEAGWVSTLKTGIAVYVDNELSYESHPGKELKSALGAWGMTANDLKKANSDNVQDDQADKKRRDDILEERDKSFDEVQGKKRGYTQLFLVAILVVTLWNLFTNRPGIDTAIMASAVFISGLAAQILLRTPTLSGGGVAITTFLLSYGLFQQFILANDFNNKLSFTFTTTSIAIGYVVYYLYYRSISKKSNLGVSTQTLPNSEIRRSISFFILLAIGNSLFASFASDELNGLWSLAVLVLSFYYIFSPFLKQRSSVQSSSVQGHTKQGPKLNKSGTKKKPSSDK